MHKRWSGDTSAHVTFFTREQGLVTALCKGGRTPKKQSLLQAFTPLWIGLDERRGWHYLNQLEMSGPSLCFVGQNLFAALYINELLYHVLHPHEADLNLYEAYVYTLAGLTVLEERLAVEVILRRFEWILLAVCGYELSFTHESRSLQPILSEAYYVYHAEEGFVLASQGIPGTHILALRDNQLSDPTVLKSAKLISRCAIDHALGNKRILTRELARHS